MVHARTTKNWNGRGPRRRRWALAAQFSVIQAVRVARQAQQMAESRVSSIFRRAGGWLCLACIPLAAAAGLSQSWRASAVYFILGFTFAPLGLMVLHLSAFRPLSQEERDSWFSMVWSGWRWSVPAAFIYLLSNNLKQATMEHMARQGHFDPSPKSNAG